MPSFFRVSASKNWDSEKSLGFGELGLGKKALFRFRKIWPKKSLCLGIGRFGLGKKSRFWFRRIWSQKKVSVSENFVSKKSLGFGLRKLGLGKEKMKITRKKLDQVNSANLLFEF